MAIKQYELAKKKYIKNRKICYFELQVNYRYKCKLYKIVIFHVIPGG